MKNLQTQGCKAWTTARTVTRITSLLMWQVKTPRPNKTWSLKRTSQLTSPSSSLKTSSPNLSSSLFWRRETPLAVWQARDTQCQLVWNRGSYQNSHETPRKLRKCCVKERSYHGCCRVSQSLTRLALNQAPLCQVKYSGRSQCILCPNQLKMTLNRPSTKIVQTRNNKFLSLSSLDTRTCIPHPPWKVLSTPIPGGIWKLVKSTRLVTE